MVPDCTSLYWCNTLLDNSQTLSSPVSHGDFQHMVLVYHLDANPPGSMLVIPYDSLGFVSTIDGSHRGHATAITGMPRRAEGALV
jgi:hypothetical protein